jgi:hypothetical protein
MAEETFSLFQESYLVSDILLSQKNDFVDILDAHRLVKHPRDLVFFVCDSDPKVLLEPATWRKAERAVHSLLASAYRRQRDEGSRVLERA